MLPVPYNSDAPLYHWPIATGCLIALNVVLFFAVPRKLYCPSNEFPAGQQFDIEAPEEASEDLENLDPAGEAVVEGEAVAPQWADPDKEWKQAEFKEPDEDEDKGGVAFRVAEPNRNDTSQFPSHTLALQHGKFKPWQWVTSMFLHDGLVHLIINMLSLWALGLIIEGKVGTLTFLVLYIAMGVGQAAIEQVLMILSSSGGGTIGSAGAIFGALGIAVIWAPKNEFDCFWAYGFRFGSVEIPVMLYGFIILVVQLLYGLLLSYFSVSALFQLAGFPIGTAVGLWWLKAKWVDCEGWDIINVWKANEGNIDQEIELEKEAFQLVRSSLSASRKERPEPEPAYFAPLPTPLTTAPDAKQLGGFWNSPQAVMTASAPAPLVESLMEVMKLIDRNEFAAAGHMYQRVQILEPHQLLPQPKLDRLMRGLLADQLYELSIPVLTEYAKRFADNRLAVQLNLAKVLIHLQRPSQAIAVLRSIDRNRLDENQIATFRKLAAHAKKQIDDGVVEFQ